MKLGASSLHQAHAEVAIFLANPGTLLYWVRAETRRADVDAAAFGTTAFVRVERNTNRDIVHCQGSSENPLSRFVDLLGELGVLRRRQSHSPLASRQSAVEKSVPHEIAATKNHESLKVVVTFHTLREDINEEIALVGSQADAVVNVFGFRRLCAFLRVLRSATL